MLALLLLMAAVPPGYSSILGSVCRTASAASGVCTEQIACPWAIEALRHGRRPKYCLKALPKVIVCCPREDIASNPSNSSSNSDLQSNDTREVGDVARRKCKEYSAFVYQEEEVSALIARRERKSQCASSADSLIVGGRDVRPMEYPHMGLVGCRCGADVMECDVTGMAFFCGGSLISTNFLLTAAHCLHIKNKPVQIVQLGSLSRTFGAGQLLNVSQVLQHPLYQPDAKYHDLGLLRLEKDAVMSGHVRPACLHTGEALGQQTPVATGWGYTDWDASEQSDVLKKVGLRLVDDAACKKNYAVYGKQVSLDRGIDAVSQVCAGGEANKDTCGGDSGGPLQVFTGNNSLDLHEPFCMYRIVGVTSFSQFDCALASIPGVYARVSYYVSWIEDTVWPEQ